MKKCLARPWKVLWSQRGSRMLMVAGRDGGIFWGGAVKWDAVPVCPPAASLLGQLWSSPSLGETRVGDREPLCSGAEWGPPSPPSRQGSCRVG